MNKNLFQPGEIKTKEGEFKLGLVHTFEKPVEEVEVEEVPQYTGPTADDLKREAEDFKVQWESEKQKMLDDAQAQADAIIESAKNAAFEEVKKQTDEAQTKICRNGECFVGPQKSKGPWRCDHPRKPRRRKTYNRTHKRFYRTG